MITTTTPSVEAALVLDSSSTDFRIALSPDEAVDWASQVGEYNNMPTGAMKQLVDRINIVVPRMQYDEGNPNNGKTFHTIHVGNSGSRFVEVRFYKGYTDRLDCDLVSLSTMLRNIGDDLQADANETTQTNRYFTHRYWWD